MYKTITLFAALAAWITGQFFIFTGHAQTGYFISFASIALGLIFYFRLWEKLTPGSTLQAQNLPAGCALIAVLLSIAGTVLAGSKPSISLWLFVFSGLFLLLAKPKNEKLFDYFKIPENPPESPKWEPWFVLALFIVTAFLRLYKLGDIPQAVGGNEGLILSNCGILNNKGQSYLPHIGGGTDWPTLTYYMGIFFAKIFGWDIANFRISSAVLGIISVMAFYFLVRRMTSALSAAIASMMYTVFLTHLVTSRIFMPVASILFIPHILCLYMLIAANKNPKWHLYLAAGLACGYSLQGYIPGRGVFVLFIAWFALMFITRQKIFYKASNSFIFWGGFLLVASPVIYFAIAHPENYWSYVASVNPSRTGGLKAYIAMILSNVSSYTAMFYTKSAGEILWHFPYKPLFDPVTSALFSSGFFMCVFTFWMPLPSALLIFFCGGMIPGMLGGGSSVMPNSIRTLMSFPLIFIFCAFAFERVRRVFLQAQMKLIYIIVITAGIAASLWSFQQGVREFFRWSTYPGLLVNLNHDLYLINKDLKKHAGASLYMTTFFVTSDAAGIYIKSGMDLSIKKYVDDMLIFGSDTDHLVCLDPLYTDTTRIFGKYFPHAEIKTYRVPKENEKDAFYTDLKLPQGYRKHSELYAPYIYVSTIFIPRQDVIDFHTMLYNGNERVKVYGGSDFAEKYSGSNMDMKGALIIPAGSVADVNNTAPVVFNLAWSGWNLNIDGKQARFGDRLKLDSGIHFFNVSGKVPRSVRGDFPMSVMQDKENAVEKGWVVAIDTRFGARVYDTPGPYNWDKPFVYSHRVVSPSMKMYDGMSLALPFSMKEVSFLKVPQDGDYSFIGNINNRCRIKINGVEVFQNMGDYPEKFTSRTIHLLKDVPSKIETYQLVEPMPSIIRALTIYVKGPGMDAPMLAPYDWFYPAD